jgi:Arc/MetJ family transcription regulator
MKTTVDVDTKAAEEAAQILGTSTLKDTVNAALREVLAADRRRRLIERISAGSLPVPTHAELARLRALKVPVGALGKMATRRKR